jgi:hypothetical protein
MDRIDLDQAEREVIGEFVTAAHLAQQQGKAVMTTAVRRARGKADTRSWSLTPEGDALVAPDLAPEPEPTFNP